MGASWPYLQGRAEVPTNVIAGDDPVCQGVVDDRAKSAVYPEGKVLGGLAGPCCWCFLGMRWRKFECRWANPYTNSNASAHSYAYSPAIAGRDDRIESAKHQRTAWRDFPIPAIQY